MRINILTVPNGVGLQRDGQLIADQLKKHNVKISSLTKSIIGKYDIAIHCEIVSPKAFKAEKNYLIPNQEWFHKEWVKWLPKYDAILVKTKHAYDIFSKLHDNVIYTSFTSKDMYLSKTANGVLHVAGKSFHKGTETIIKAWKPNYPTLRMIKDRRNILNTNPNINYTYGRINEDAYQDLLNTHNLHLCTSQSEGWGHYIWEAMSTGAAVITTDAPPMNEFIHDLLVPYENSEPMHLGTKYFISEKGLQDITEKALSLDLAAIGQENRSKYEANHNFFTEQFKAIFE